MAATMSRGPDFVGRGWAFDRIRTWLGGRDPVLVISGQPGAGKSTLVDRILAISTGQVTGPIPKGSIHANHSCRHAEAGTIDPFRVLQEVSGQLARRVPTYAGALMRGGDSGRTSIKITQRIGRVENSTIVGVQINLASVSLRSAFLRLLREPLERIKQPSGLVVVIDALDESEEGAAPMTLASLLGLEMATPVTGLRFLLTTRPGRALDHVSQWPRFDLIDDEPAAGRDVFVYVRRRLSRVSDDAWRPLAERISVESRGNFLYARHVVDHAVRSGFAASALAAPLPSKLADLYRGFLLREVAHGPLAWQERFRPLLGALCQALGDGLTRAHLVAISRLSEEEVDDTLASCRPYLTGNFPLGPFRLYHPSLNDYLRTPGEHYVYPLTRTMAIVRALTTAWSDQWSRCDDRYALAALLRHLRDLAQSLVVDERQYGLQWLTRLYNDPAFLYRKFIVEGVSEALFDLASSTFEIKIDNALFKTVLAELAEEQRLTIYLADFERFSEIEIAYIMGRPIEAVTGDLRTARYALREFVGHRARP